MLAPGMSCPGCSTKDAVGVALLSLHQESFAVLHNVGKAYLCQRMWFNLKMLSGQSASTDVHSPQRSWATGSIL